MGNKNYDFKKAKQLIEERKDSLKSASLGMHEDWFWTAETIWESGEYRRELPDNADEIYKEYVKERASGMSLLSEEAKKYDSILVGGIYGSHWATPTLQLTYNDDSDEMIECSTGEQDISLGDKIEQQMIWTSGCLSEPVQENITPLKTK